MSVDFDTGMAVTGSGDQTLVRSSDSLALHSIEALWDVETEGEPLEQLFRGT